MHIGTFSKMGSLKVDLKAPREPGEYILRFILKESPDGPQIGEEFTLTLNVSSDL